MEDVGNLVKTTVGEIEKLLNTKTVVGDPIVVEGKTLIPLISVGFGFGAGAGSGKMALKGEQEGSGGGTGGGAGIKPVAVIIVDKEGVRIESIKGGIASALEKIGESLVPLMMKKCGGGESPKESSGK
jgi:uncharacterized spore protein YtfJ